MIIQHAQLREQSHRIGASHLISFNCFPFGRLGTATSIASRIIFYSVQREREREREREKQGEGEGAGGRYHGFARSPSARRWYRNRGVPRRRVYRRRQLRNCARLALVECFRWRDLADVIIKLAGAKRRAILPADNSVSLPTLSIAIPISQHSGARAAHRVTDHWLRLHDALRKGRRPWGSGSGSARRTKVRVARRLPSSFQIISNRITRGRRGPRCNPPWDSSVSRARSSSPLPQRPDPARSGLSRERKVPC